MSVLLFALLSALILLSVDLLSYLIGRKGWSRFVSTFLIFYSQIIVTEFALGLVSALNRTTLVTLNLAISVGLLIWLSRRFGNKRIKKYFSAARKSVIRVKDLLISDPLWFTLLILAGGFVLWVVFLGIIFPATDFDGNSYHLTFVGNVIRNHNFFDVTTSLPWLNGYPKGGEFMQMWSVIITRGDMFSDLTQVPFVLLGVYALYEIGVTLGVDKKQARFSATTFVFLPIVLNQLKTTYVDVMLAALFFAAVALVIKRKRDKLDLILIGVIYSLLISIKPTGVLFVAVTVPLLVWGLYRDLGSPVLSKVTTYIKSLALIAAPLWFGLYWYVKNTIIYGSALHPFGLKLGSLQIFPGKTFQEFAADAVTQTALPSGYIDRIWFVWTEQKDWYGCLYNYDTNYAGLGPIWFVVLLPAILISAYFAIKKRNVLYAAVSASIMALFLLYPANYYTRYTMFITGIGILAFGIVLSGISRITGNITKLLVIILALYVIGTNFVMCNFSAAVIKDQLKSLVAGSDRGAIYNNLPGPAFTFIEDRLEPGDVVTYDSKPYFIYPLWRPDFANDVIYVPATGKQDWYQGLNKEGVDYVFTVVYSRENEWAKDQLDTIYKDEMYEVFQVN